MEGILSDRIPVSTKDDFVSLFIKVGEYAGPNELFCETSSSKMTLNAVTDALKRLTNDDQLESSPSSVEDENGEYFCVEDTFLSKDISVTVNDIGKLTFPLTEECVKNLIKLSSKAKFGRGEDTLLDTSVRDTQMIPANKLKVEINEESLASALERIGSGLNINANSTLVPHLYNMLIYGPGQFFQMHRDSEKIKNMVATLVIVLPYAHKGGDLIIQHNKKEHIFFGSRNPDFVKCVVFYSDCQHEIKKVTEGFRVALTYNVALESPEIASDLDVNENLNSAVDSFFSRVDQPKRLIYYLNHSYSEHSLKWDLLKGTDRTHATALFAVAKKQGRVPCLALAEYKETYDTQDDTELLDSETNLYYWVDDHNLSFKETSNVNENEICYTMDTTELFEPFKTEESGPTGNEGETTDHWYRRACVVLWSSKWSFKNGFKQALYDLHQLTTETGKEQLLLEEINKVAHHFFQTKFWGEPVVKGMLVDIAMYLNNTEMAILILSELPQELLTQDQLDRLVQLERQYGEEAWIKITESWKRNCNWFMIVSEAVPFIQKYLKYCGSQLFRSIIIGELLKEAVKKFISPKPTNTFNTLLFGYRHQNYNEEYVYGRTNDEKTEKLCKLLLICAELKALPLEQKLIHHMVSHPSVYPPVSLAELVFKLKDILTPDQFVHYKILRDSALTAVNNQLSKLKNNSNDWYWPFTIPCHCKYCTLVQAFFHSRTSRKVIVPAAKASRKHVYSFLNPLSNQPIKFFTERTGSPFKIVIEKDPKLLTDRTKLLKDLTELQNKLKQVNFVELPELVQLEENVNTACDINSSETVAAVGNEESATEENQAGDNSSSDLPTPSKRQKK